MKTWAVFSSCRTWRYELGRDWDGSKPLVMFVGLNPSTADETEDDPTIRRCIGFARSWGAGGMLMANIFAFRSTDPKALKRVSPDNPLAVIGPENDARLLDMARRANGIVAAWGVHGVLHSRGEAVTELLTGRLKCLGTTKDGHPKHPLYLRADTELEVFS